MTSRPDPVLAERAPARPKQARPSPTSTPTDDRDATIDFEWEDPPKRTNGRRSIAEVLADAGVLERLRAQPQAWARVVRYGSNSGAGASATKLRKTLGDDFQWTAKRIPRTVEEQGQGSILYGRFVAKDVE